MSMCERKPLVALFGALALSTVLSACQSQPVRSGQPFGLGTPVDAAQLAAWNIDIDADGRGLPPGSGTVAAGQRIYETRCIACHGVAGQNGIADRLAGGQGSLATKTPVRTVGSFWPYATILFDYVRRAMPFDSPQSLSPDEVYAVSAYVLHLNGLLPADGRLDAASLPRIVMPNRDGFKVDDRPDVVGTRCMKDCAPGS